VRGSGFGSVVFGKVGYGLACLAAAIVFVVSWYAHSVVAGVDGIAAGASLGSNVPPASAQNILLMGLESRTDFQGHFLSSAQLTQTHSGKESTVQAGSAGAGSQDTDTLILIHVFAGGQKATGYSIPRDDVVNFPHEVNPGTGEETEGKIDAAYLYAYDQYLSQNNGKMSSNDLYVGANKAGQLFETETVESVTGVHIDHFVVSNIEGFFQIAQQLGGINVCIAPAPASIEPAGEGFVTGSNLVDLPYAGANFKLQSNSGFDAFKDGYNEKKNGAQYIHLQPAQALAFVRARDSLPGVDIGRTARQQAAIDFIIYDFKHRNVLTDPGLISSMVNSAKSYLQTDQTSQGNWLLDFAPQMRSLTGSHLKMSTLADAAVQNITIPGYPGLQDANYIYVPNLQQTVNGAFYGSAAVNATKSVTVDVYNGSGAGGLAGEVSQAFAAAGYTAGKAGNASALAQQLQGYTQVFYGTGAQANAESIADNLGAMTSTGTLGATALSSLPAGHVEVLLGQQVTALPAGLESFGATTVTGQDFVAAAQQNKLPASEMPPATATGTTAATQSVSATEIGVRAAAPAQSAASAQSAAPASTATTSSSYNGPRPADVPAGIPCVY
jgi:anionic cell wall polymer biosynthesis LytR-Cps2A-Psr (LCP) family protein